MGNNNNNEMKASSLRPSCSDDFKKFFIKPASHFPFSSVGLQYRKQLVLNLVQLIFSDYELVNQKTREPKSK